MYICVGVGRCVGVRVYVYVWCNYGQHLGLSFLDITYVCVYVYTRKYVRVCLFVYVYVCLCMCDKMTGSFLVSNFYLTHIYVYSCTCVYTFVCVWGGVWIYFYLCMCDAITGVLGSALLIFHICMCICVHVYAHTCVRYNDGQLHGIFVLHIICTCVHVSVHLCVVLCLVL